VRKWCINYGISILDGEGAYFSTDRNANPSTSPPLCLNDDKLRNGITLCDLIKILEPNAASNLQLHKYVKRKVLTLDDAKGNLYIALHILRLRRCPPIPLGYLIQVQLFFYALKKYSFFFFLNSHP
jgi:hypothetical protein